MVKNKSFNKIESFVKDQVKRNHGSVIITELKGGYLVNDFKVLSKDDAWIVADKQGANLSKLFTKRLAVLFAALTAKKKYNLASTIPTIDMQFNTLRGDKILFEYRISKGANTELFEDRLSRTAYELSTLQDQISELEKSVGLQ